MDHREITKIFRPLDATSDAFTFLENYGCGLSLIGSWVQGAMLHAMSGKSQWGPKWGLRVLVLDCWPPISDPRPHPPPPTKIPKNERIYKISGFVGPLPIFPSKTDRITRIPIRANHATRGPTNQ